MALATTAALWVALQLALQLALGVLLLAAVVAAVGRGWPRLAAAAGPAPTGAAAGAAADWAILALDLDETLVHAEEVQGGELRVALRPHVFPFLRSVRQLFDEVVLFTAATREYADAVLRLLDPAHAVFSRRFYREDCTPMPDGSLAKDLRIVLRGDRPAGTVHLVDNTPAAYALQPRAGVPIESFLGDPADDALPRLLPTLARLGKNSASRATPDRLQSDA